MNRLIAAIVVCALVLLPLEARATNYGTWNVEASYVYTDWFYLPAGITVIFHTDNITPSHGDTVMHLLDSYGQEVAMNDDNYPLLSSIIGYTPTSNGYYKLVVRSYSNSTGGQCRVYKDAQQIADTYFGGYHFSANTYQSTDVVQTALLNQGTDDTVLYSINGFGSLTAIDDDGGVGFASRLSGIQMTVLIATYSHSSATTTRVVVNDAGSDCDGDGLGNALEADLCTCDAPSQPTCGMICNGNAIRTTQDSDGDGIRDDWEVLGREKDFSDPYDFPQHLPQWGANPLRKDLFVEMDWIYQTGHQVQGPEAMKVVQAYGAAGSYQAIKNRDGSNGVSVHMDIGRASTGTDYGAWGGAGEVPVGSGWQPPTLAQFVKSRRNIFHYGLATSGQGGNANEPGWGFRADHDEGLTIAHELGHNLDLTHGGRHSSTSQNGKPNYKSIMSYAYEQLTLSDFSQGEFLTAPLNPASLCEADGLQTTDRSKLLYLAGPPYNYTVENPCNDANPKCGIDWNRDGTISSCSSTIRAAPNFQRGPLASPELGRYYSYREVFQPYTTTSADATATPSLTRWRNNLYLAYRDTSGQIKLLYSSGDFKTGCPELYGGCQSWSSFQVAATSDAAGPAMAVYTAGGSNEHLVVVWQAGGKLKYAILSFDASAGHLFVDLDDVPGTTGIIYEPSLANYNGDLMLVYRKGTAGAEDTVYANTLPVGSTTWGASTAQIRDEDSQPLKTYSVLAAASHPGGMNGVFTDQLGMPFFQFYMKWRKYKGNSRWAEINDSQMDNNAWAGGIYPPTHRVGLAWIPHLASTGLSGGRWYLAYKYSTAGRGLVFFNMTRGDGTNSTLVWENWGRYDNEWYGIENGVALHGWRPNSGTGVAEENLRFSTVFSENPTTKLLDFRPFADGIVDVSLKDSNDFEVMERGLCAGLYTCTGAFCLLSGETHSCPGTQGKTTTQNCAL